MDLASGHGEGVGVEGDVPLPCGMGKPKMPLGHKYTHQ